MKAELSNKEQLQEEFVEVLQGVDEGSIDSIDLYRSLHLLEYRYKASGYPVPKELERLECDFEREFCAISQGRD